MSEIARRFYATSVSSATVVLSPEPGVTGSAPAGEHIQQITVVTLESTAAAAFWGVTGSCGRYQVIIRKVT